MIHVFVGTKAQLIKMVPILQVLEQRGIVYNLIDTGQHAGLTAELVSQFGLHQPNVLMCKERKNVDSIAQAAAWTARHFSRMALTPGTVCREVFKAQQSICLIHGDTLSTLIALCYAKMCGIPVAHIEAGLRSFHLLDPFPEEIIRRIIMRYSDLLFAPSEWAFENLRRMNLQNKAVNVGANTGKETVEYAVKRLDATKRPRRPYVVVTIHRVETIYSRLRLTKVLDLVARIARERKVIFVLHEPTRRQFLRFEMLSKIAKIENVELSPLLPYMEFLGLVAGADYVVTDGGSIQEECYHLNKPCMIVRSKTERLEGLGENALLTGFDQNKINRFFENIPALKRQDLNQDIHPSAAIVDHLLQWLSC